MPLTTLRPQVTDRFHEVDTFLSSITAREDPDPRNIDSAEVRVLRGLFYVHLYGAFEFSVDQAFIRVAQHITSHAVTDRHLEKSVLSLAMDDMFSSIRNLSSWEKRLPKRLELLDRMSAATSSKIPDTVLSEGMMSLKSPVIRLAFKVYGLKDDPFINPAAGTYLDEDFERRCAVAHGRESPIAVGMRRTPELRLRYNALYSQAIYVLDKLQDFIASKKFVAGRHRAKYP